MFEKWITLNKRNLLHCFAIQFDDREKSNTVLLMKTITFKVSEEEAQQIRLLAKKEKINLSEYMRRRAFLPTKKNQKLIRSKCPLTGVTVLSAPNLPPLSTETVRELLSNFP
jgi:hypothetical protein